MIDSLISTFACHETYHTTKQSKIGFVDPLYPSVYSSCLPYLNMSKNSSSRIGIGLIGRRLTMVHVIEYLQP
jgi:hypothetical protein